MDAMIDEREELDRAALLPEAGGVAYADLWSPLGLKICVTARGANPIEALDDLISTIKYGMEVYKLTAAVPGAPSRQTSAPPPEPPAPLDPLPAGPPAKANGAGAPKTTPQPVGEPVGGTEEIVTFTVEKIEAQMTPNGKPTFKVFGGAFSKYGVNCWPEVLGEQFDLEAVKTGDTWTTNGLTARALRIDGKVKKVIGFVS